MITRCPACATAFRVTDTQLRIRNGQVRCGRCGAQFDATTSLSTGLGDVSGSADPGGPVSVGGPAPILTVDRDAPFDFGPKVGARESRIWLPACVLLVIIALAQGIFRYRGDIAVLFPEVKPLLVEACAKLGCGIPLPRRAELLSIESSDLQADGTHPNVMVLTATLRNRAGFAQTLPALELTLTNAQDQAVARRVLVPHEYAVAGTALAAGFAPSSELHVRVYLETPALKPTGYRLYLFYS